MKNGKDEMIDRRQLHKKVLEHLREAILNGEFCPGEFIRLQQIAEQLGVSQMPVREALKELEAEALVEQIPYRGVRVVQYRLEDLADLFALRSFLEGRTTCTAASVISDGELEHLFNLVDEMKSAVATEQVAEYRELNHQFHQTVYRASKSIYLIQALDKLWSTYPTMLHGNFPHSAPDTISDRDKRDVNEHRAIVIALQKRETKTAERLMFEHIQKAGEELIATLEEYKSKEAKGNRPQTKQIQVKNLLEEATTP
jgi:DNA-binding GntR family transcriptional regulator